MAKTKQLLLRTVLHFQVLLLVSHCLLCNEWQISKICQNPIDIFCVSAIIYIVERERNLETHMVRNPNTKRERRYTNPVDFSKINLF